MQEEPKLLTGFMLRDGRGSCFISPEESKKIAEWEDKPLPNPCEKMPHAKWVEIARNIEKTLPESEKAYHRANMNQIAREIGESLPFPEEEEKSKSFIMVLCEEDADPKYNIIQLRDEPPTLIPLQPGMNILTVEQYPALKYGFRQIEEFELSLEDSPYEWNGTGIVEIDFSHFNADEMTSMDDMFSHMGGLQKINWGDTKVPNIKTAREAFCRTGEDALEDLPLSNMKFSRLVDAEGMFWGCGAKVINLTGFDFSELKEVRGMFGCCESEKVILDNSKDAFRLLEGFSFAEDDISSEISLKGCEESTIRAFAIAVEDAIKNYDRSVKLNLGNKYDYKVATSENGEKECLIIRKYHHTTSNKSYCKLQGSTLIEFLKKDDSHAIIPDGVTAIGEGAFKGCSTLEIVYLPRSVKQIGDQAFSGCKNLKFIHIPERVEKIGYEVFDGCEHLHHLYIPDSVKSIGGMNYTGVHFRHLRIPLKLLLTGCLDSTYLKINYLVVGMPENPRDLGKTPLGRPYIMEDAFNYEIFNFEPHSRPYVMFEAYEDSHFAGKEFITIDGIIIGDGDIPEEEEDDFLETGLCAYNVPSYSLALPDGVERLIDFCLSNRDKNFPLFIPESVQIIDKEAIERDQLLITPGANYSELKRILPVSINKVRIVEI